MAESNGGSFDADANRVLDDVLEKLRWCRDHIHDRSTSQTLRQLEARLGYLAQALTWDMDGEAKRSRTALNIALGRPRREVTYFPIQDPHGWDIDWWMHGH